MRNFLVMFCLFSFFSFINSQVIANEWVDMGPLKGSAEGHIWSKVVDEVGNTQGRNEEWQLSLPCSVNMEFIVKCPDSYSLEVSLNYQHDWHGIIELKPDRTADGFYCKNYNFKDAHLIKNFNIKVYSRKPSTDQKYQLIVNMQTLDGKALSPSNTAVTSSENSLANNEPQIEKRLTQLLNELPPEKYATLYADISMLIARTGTAEAGWINGMDSTSPLQDEGRGLLNEKVHYEYCLGSGKTRVPELVGMRLKTLQGILSSASFSRLCANLNARLNQN